MKSVADNLCPICSRELDSMDEAAAMHHVNKCLDAGEEQAAKKAKTAPAPARKWRLTTGGLVWSCSADKTALPEGAGFTLVSLNVWFEPHYARTRFSAQFQALERMQPTFIALQEVTPPYWEALKKLEWVARDYHIIGPTPEPYGICLLSRLKPVKARVVRLRSVMGRTLLVATMADGLTVCTTHLESMTSYAQTRIYQLGEIKRALSNEENVVIAGDFNFCGTNVKETENAAVPAFLEDAVTQRPGYTIGITYPSKKFPQKRFDRVLYKSSKWKPVESSYFGTERVPVWEGERDMDVPGWIRARGCFLSDHLGVNVQFEPKV